MDMFAERVIENINTDDVITDVIAPVLDEYFTVKELTLLADFAEMPIAQKLVTSALNDEKIDMEAMMVSNLPACSAEAKVQVAADVAAFHAKAFTVGTAPLSVEATIVRSFWPIVTPSLNRMPIVSTPLQARVRS